MFCIIQTSVIGRTLVLPPDWGTPFLITKMKMDNNESCSIFLLTTTLLIFSGCAVIDFLDGKHLNHSPNHDNSQFRSGNGSGGSGHSH
jgi:hypothetical protein